MRENTGLFITVSVLLILPILVWAGYNTYAGIVFDVNCQGHLKRASDANTTELAQKELLTALKYMEENELTKGNTSIFWRTPSNDVAFWYQNIKSASEELNKITPETSQLERVNVLMKLRETLLDKDKVTCPDSISLHPNNVPNFYLGVLTGLLMIAGVILLCATIGELSH
jgi:hypothetical protein